MFKSRDTTNMLMASGALLAMHWHFSKKGVNECGGILAFVSADDSKDARQFC